SYGCLDTLPTGDPRRLAAATVTLRHVEKFGPLELAITRKRARHAECSSSAHDRTRQIALAPLRPHSRRRRVHGRRLLRRGTGPGLRWPIVRRDEQQRR